MKVTLRKLKIINILILKNNVDDIFDPVGRNGLILVYNFEPQTCWILTYPDE